MYTEWNAEEAARFSDTLRGGAEAIGVPLTDLQVDACLTYSRLLLATNAHTNLTRITDPEEVAIKHFVDSLTVLWRGEKDGPLTPAGGGISLAPQRVGAGGASGRITLCDVGTGAGFPGIVLKIVRPNLHVTLLDSLAKRLTFLGQVVAELELKNVRLVHSRAEDAGRNPALRDRFHVVTARAVASLPTLLEWCGPLVTVGGHFVAMKAAGAEEELATSANAAEALQLRLVERVGLELPVLKGGEKRGPLAPINGGTSGIAFSPAPPFTGAGGALSRHLLLYEKTNPTPKLYPRLPAEIKKRPL